MIQADAGSLVRWVQEARTAAANPEHEWDKRAIDWPHINENSVVFEIGSFKGRWAFQICQKYSPRMFCFEPQRWAAQTTEMLLKPFNARVFNFGLASRNKQAGLVNFGSDAATAVEYATEQTMGLHMVEMRDMAQVVVQLELDLEEINLCLINIEGGEYELVPYMLKKRILPQVMMIQYHGNTEHYMDMQPQLDRFYDVLWSYGMTLTAYVRKESA